MDYLKLTLCTLLLTLLVACGSTPRSNYYMLSADARGTPGSTGLAIGVGPVNIPDYLKAREMVLNRSEHKLKIADYDRWAEPLDSGVSRVVAINLAVLLATQDVQIFPWRRDTVPEFAVRIAVVQFAVQGRDATLVCEWTVSRPRQGEALSQHITQVNTGMRDSDPESIAAAYSELLLQLSQKIATAIDAHQVDVNPGAG